MVVDGWMDGWVAVIRQSHITTQDENTLRVGLRIMYQLGTYVQICFDDKRCREFWDDNGRELSVDRQGI